MEMELQAQSLPTDTLSEAREPLPAEFHHLDLLSHLLDDAFHIPGTRWRLGMDSLLGLLPVGGDALGVMLSAYIIGRSKRLGARPSTLAKMVANVAFDFAIGAMPVVGDILDVAFKANRRNVRLLQRDLLKKSREKSI